jgi:hypothetical protein
MNYIKQIGGNSFLILPKSQYCLSLRIIKSLFLSIGENRIECIRLELINNENETIFITHGDENRGHSLNESKEFIDWMKETFLCT